MSLREGTQKAQRPADVGFLCARRIVADSHELPKFLDQERFPLVNSANQHSVINDVRACVCLPRNNEPRLPLRTTP